MPELSRLIAVALGESPADLVIKNARVWNSFTGGFTLGDLAVCGERIAGIGTYNGREEYDAQGKYLLPGFIDAHVHIESSLLAPAEFARALAPTGTTCVIADPHEIANAAGLPGLHWLLEATENLPLRVYIMLPSCVPAGPFEEGAARLEAEDLAPLLDHPRVLGLGEMMNFPGVLGRDPSVLRKLRLAHERRALIDGHCPGVSGKALTAYAAAGVSSDHECSTADEARARLELGMALMLRQGSAAKNLLDLLPAVSPENEQRCMFASDDRNPRDIFEQGGVNYMVRLALAAGQPLRRAINMASLNCAAHFGLRDLGALAPGLAADMALYPDPEHMRPELVLCKGRRIFQAGRAPAPPSSAPASEATLRAGLRLGKLNVEKLALPATGATARVIGFTYGQLVTEELRLDLPVRDGCFLPEPARDVAKLCVWERHKGTGKVGAGLVRGLGLRRGALASTVAHDAHNLIIAGCTDEDMLFAARGLAELGGGLIAVENGNILAALPLPLGGILSADPLERVLDQLNALHAAAHGLGIPENRDPFMPLAFLGLTVIPQLKLSCFGLLDVARGEIVPVSV